MGGYVTRLIQVFVLCLALAVRLRERIARGLPRGFYMAGLVLIGTLPLRRGPSTVRFVVWAGICELTGFLLVAAFTGWVLRRFPVIAARLRMAGQAQRRTGGWFCWAQAALAVVSSVAIGWILLDPAFDALGHGIALFGLAGRVTACPAALMLLGMAIVMAWQTQTTWRAAWQYAALATGVLLTSSIGWSRLDPAAPALWSRRGTSVLISVSMMTLLTWFGLARILPHSGDWLIRARRTTPVFAGLALLLATIALIRWLVG